MTTQILILAAGPRVRLGITAKQLVHIGAEPLLGRTLRQLGDLQESTTVVTHLPEIQEFLDRFVPKQKVYEPQERRWCVETFLDTQSLWGDRTIIIPGDVVYHDVLMARILNCQDQLRVFGGKHPFAEYDEIFGITFTKEQEERVVKALKAAIEDAEKGGRGFLWEFYRALCGLPLHQHNLEQAVFESVDDGFTADLDNITQYRAFLDANPWALPPKLKNAKPGAKLEYLITGTGRCGTGYAAKVLESVGIECGHEVMYGIHTPNPLSNAVFPGEASWMAAPFLETEEVKGAKVIHLVRHPKHVIESWLSRHAFEEEPENDDYGDLAFKYAYLPTLRNYDTPLLRMVHYYIEWNKKIERLAPAAVRVRVEEGPQAILSAVGLEPGDKPLFDNRRYNTHTRIQRRFNLADIPDESLRNELFQMCERYGYDATLNAKPQVFYSLLIERSVQYENVNSMLDAAMVAGKRGYIRLGLGYKRTDMARNELAWTFFELAQNPDDVLVMLDCDHEHPAFIIDKLVGHNLPVVGAIAFRRSKPYEPMAFFKRHGVLRSPAGYEQAVYQCDALGHAAIAIKRSVFEQLREAGHTFFWEYKYHDGQRFSPSEDIYFSTICTKNNIPLYVDCTLVTPHLRTDKVTDETWREYRDAHPEILSTEVENGKSSSDS